MNKKRKITLLAVVLIALAVLTTFAMAARGNKTCNNGVDNDNDGLVDYPNDPGCS